MTTNLTAASRQWASRPADERFWNLQDLDAHTRKMRDGAKEAEVNLARLKVLDMDGDLRLVSHDSTGRQGTPAHFTNFSFGQFCRRLEAPAEYLSRMPSHIAASCLNTGLMANGGDKANLLLHQNGQLTVRAALSDKYDRIWNADLTNRLANLPQGWRTPPARPAFPNQPGTRPATEKDVLESKAGGGGLSINVGDLIAPAGLYASDRDMFVFQVNEQNRIKDGTPEGLSRGFFLQNSEVGDSALKMTMFLYRHCCGNHIVWDASQINTVRIRHIGNANNRAWALMGHELNGYAHASAAGIEANIGKAKVLCLGPNKDAVLDMLFGKRISTRKILEASWDAAERNIDQDGAPDTAWGFAQGMTRFSQTVQYANVRTAIDRAAGEVLALAN
jgi:hypothetical protein